ncbi:ABC transporter permease [Phaeacidiphilus oryzae]|uniref:ABC transporter permease n=1 Tax=Phaeacidiphilus oryzae TaxID=348818 RepID=UPI00055DF4BC|nr:ABC transporter permease [Phaeacidiphilus oryzae]
MTGPVPLPRPARLRPADVLRVGVAGLRGRRLRAVLSALGIAIGIAAMVAVLGISDAGKADLLARIGRLGTNMLTVSPGQDVFGRSTELPADAEEMVRRIDPVQSATATGLVQGATVRRTDLIDPRATGGIAVAAARTELLGTVRGAVASGSFLNAATARYPAVVLGSVAASTLGIDHPGEEVWIANRWFTVIGLLQPVALAPELDRSALVGWPEAQRELGFDGRPTTVYERSADEEVDAVRGVLAATADPAHPEDVKVSRPSDALAAQLAAKSAFTSLFLGLGAVALLVGGVGVANTMVISVLERRQEIGLRRALGAARGQIRLQFLTESVALSGGGGLCGAVLGSGISAGYALWRHWPATVPPESLAAGAGSALVIGTLAGLYPAGRAARLSPTEALNTV